MRFIKKNMVWIIAIGVIVWKNWDKIAPMLGMNKDETAKAIEDETTLTDNIA